MTRKELTFWVAAFITAICIASIYAYVSITKYEKAVEINAQTEVERTRLEEEAKLARTKERMNWVPWYRGK